jgi:hypothetical protein
MTWSASVLSKRVEEGVTIVNLQFTDGAQTIPDTIRSSAPSLAWVQGVVRDRILALNTTDTIPLGAVTPAEAPPAEDTALTLFRNRCELLFVIKVLIDLGAVQADNAKVVALVNWVKNNFAANIDKM